jgi:hypothetical protein
MDNLNNEFEKLFIDIDDYDERFLLYNSKHENTRKTLIRYKRYLLFINFYEMPIIKTMIIDYINNPRKDLKDKIDKDLIYFIETLEKENEYEYC